MSSTRLISTASFQAGRTIAAAVPRAAACSCASRPGISLGECSVSNRIQSNPESDTISAAMLLARLLHRPICSRPAAIACLKVLRGRSIGKPFMVAACSWRRTGNRPGSNPGRAFAGTCGSYELHGDAAERAEVGVQRVALLRKHHARERAGQHEMTGLQRNPMRSELVGEPGDAERRMAEDTGRHAGLLDLGVAIHDAADPAQVDVHGADRAPTDHDAGG